MKLLLFKTRHVSVGATPLALRANLPAMGQRYIAQSSHLNGGFL